MASPRGITLFLIDSGSVYMKSACCENNTCVKQGKISKEGESIICLPNKVVITVIIDGEDNSPDIVT